MATRRGCDSDANVMAFNLVYRYLKENGHYETALLLLEEHPMRPRSNFNGPKLEDVLEHFNQCNNYVLRTLQRNGCEQIAKEFAKICTPKTSVNGPLLDKHVEVLIEFEWRTVRNANEKIEALKKEIRHLKSELSYSKFVNKYRTNSNDAVAEKEKEIASLKNVMRQMTTSVKNLAMETEFIENVNLKEY